MVKLTALRKHDNHSAPPVLESPDTLASSDLSAFFFQSGHVEDAPDQHCADGDNRNVATGTRALERHH